MTAKHPLNRLAWLDIARGFGIILVVVGHAIRPAMLEVAWCDFLFRLIYSFHMPLFFVLSGYTYSLSRSNYLSSPKTFAQKKIKSLLIPLFTWATLVYLFFFVANSIPQLSQLLSSASLDLVNPIRYLSLMLIWENPYAAHLWYIWVLFIVTLAVFGFEKLTGSIRHPSVLLFFSSLLIYLAALIFSPPTAIYKMMTYLLYFTIGILFARSSVLLAKIKPFFTALSIIGVLTLLATSWMGTCRIIPQHGAWLTLQTLLQMIAVIPSIFGFLRLCRTISLRTNLSILSKAGKSSFAVYLIHQPFCCAFAGILFYDLLKLPILATLVICTALSFLIPFTVVMIARRVKWIGRITQLLLNI